MPIAMLYGVGGGGLVGNDYVSYFEGSMTEITANDFKGATKIRPYGFYADNNLLRADIPNITQLQGNVFAYCYSLNRVTFSKLSVLSWNNFRGCSSLTEIILPNTLTVLGGNEFRDCSALEKIVINTLNNVTLAATSSFDNTNNCPIYVPYAKISAYYSTATNWSSLISRIFPLVATTSDLTSIDTAYTRACVIGNEEYAEYTYDGSSWNIVT